jgi:predicted metal-dependent phosphoesterase TrpH
LSHYDSDDEIELRALLKTVSDKGLKALTIAELDRLRGLLEAKDYGDNKRADKSKRKLLKQINSTFYDRHRPSRLL